MNKYVKSVYFDPKHKFLSPRLMEIIQPTSNKTQVSSKIPPFNLMKIFVDRIFNRNTGANARNSQIFTSYIKISVLVTICYTFMLEDTCPVANRMSCANRKSILCTLNYQFFLYHIKTFNFP